jgi:hypothetical protein
VATLLLPEPGVSGRFAEKGAKKSKQVGSDKEFLSLSGLDRRLKIKFMAIIVGASRCPRHQRKRDLQ